MRASSTVDPSVSPRGVSAAPVDLPLCHAGHGLPRPNQPDHRPVILGDPSSRRMGAPVKVYVIHENPQWYAPLAAAFDAAGVPHQEWLLGSGLLDLDAAPPAGVFWSRMSASSHTRGHPFAKDHARAVLCWLEAHGRRVVNGRRVLELEVSKADRLTALRAAGLDVPRTVVVAG